MEVVRTAVIQLSGKGRNTGALTALPFVLCWTRLPQTNISSLVVVVGGWGVGAMLRGSFLIAQLERDGMAAGKHVEQEAMINVGKRKTFKKSDVPTKLITTTLTGTIPGQKCRTNSC